MLTIYLIASGVLLVSVIAAARSRLIDLSKMKLCDSGHNPVQLMGTNSTDYLVFVFLSPECPVSQQYTFELNALAKNNRAKFYGVVPGDFYDAARVNDFKKKYSLSFPLLLDTELKLTRSLGASVTPQAIVVEHNDILYSGAIDNTYISLGKRHATTTAHYLKDALLALQNKQPVKIKKTNAIGCLIDINEVEYKN